MTTTNVSVPHMNITQDVEIPMSDGGLLRANLYLPRDAGPVPALVTTGPYGKDHPVSALMPDLWTQLTCEHPDVLSGSSGHHLPWEVPDPERRTPHGYAVIHIDARGADWATIHSGPEAGSYLLVPVVT